MLLPDVNVYLYARRRESPRHEECHDWLTRLLEGPEPVAVSELVLSAFLRIVTNHRVSSSWQSCCAGAWHPTAALVVEILSPGDETFEKLSFYAEHQVDELMIVDPAERRVRWLGLVEAECQPIKHSGLIDLGSVELQEQIDWPPVA